MNTRRPYKRQINSARFKAEHPVRYALFVSAVATTIVALVVAVFIGFWLLIVGGLQHGE